MKWRLFHRQNSYRLERKLYHLLSDDYCGNDTMPLDRRALRFKTREGIDEVAVFENDAFEIGLGYPDKWHHFYDRKDFNRIIRWYIWSWAYSEWFGLRRWLWYKLLHRWVSRNTSRPEEDAPQDHDNVEAAS